MRKKLVVFIGALAVLVMLSGSTWAESVTLKYNYFGPPTSWDYVNISVPFLKRVEKDSEGTVKFDLYPGGTLGRSPAKQLKIVKDRVADIVWTVQTYNPGVFADDVIANYPADASSLEATLAINGLHERGLLRGYEDIVPLGIFALAQYLIHTNFPVKSPQDLKGAKIRAAGAMQSKLVEALGAVPVGLSITKVVESISRGVIGGTILEWNGMTSWGCGAVTNYHCVVPFGTVSLLFAMNKKSYESLPPKAKAALDKHMGLPLAKEFGEKMTAYSNKTRRTFMKDPKHTVYYPTADEMAQFKALMNPVLKSWEESNLRFKELAKTYKEELAKVK